jgi:hypothetical protein
MLYSFYISEHIIVTYKPKNNHEPIIKKTPFSFHTKQTCPYTKYVLGDFIYVST